MEDTFKSAMMDEFLPLRDVVFRTLRQAILTGEMKPGERLLEIHLANKLGVSRTPIREAIRMLELEGLVVMVPRRGAQVAQITEKSMSDVLEVRCALDELAVALACERIEDEEIEELKDACEDFEKIIETKDIQKIAKADIAIHDVIYKASGNPRLTQLINNLAEQMYRYRFEYLKDETQHQALCREHWDIYKNVKKRDTEVAKELIRLHVENQEKSIIKQIKLERAKKN